MLFKMTSISIVNMFLAGLVVGASIIGSIIATYCSERDHADHYHDSRVFWKANRSDWYMKAEAFFRDVDEGSWKYGDESTMSFFLKTQPILVHVGKNESIHCLRHKWILMRGDSSLRFLFASLVQYLGGTPLAIDPYMPKYNACKEQDCRGFITGRHGNHSDPGGDPIHYFREYWNADNSLRITFCFVRFLEERSIIVEQFITNSMQPDLLIIEGGPWDRMIYNDTVEKSVNKLKTLINDIPRYYNGPMIWVDLIACAHKVWTAEFSSKSRDVVDVPTMSRYATTINLPHKLLPLCDGWHAYGQLSDFHRDMLLYALCMV